MTGRFGNFFTHFLLGVSEDVDAGRAILSWDADFWRRADDDGHAELPDVPHIPETSHFDHVHLEGFLSNAGNCEILSFVLTAILSTKPDQRVFVAAPASAIAWCVHIATVILPGTVLQDFSFSTYESEPLRCNARLVGTAWIDACGMDLPSSCYMGSAVGYNSYSGRKTELAQLAFVDYAVRALRSHNARESLGRFCRLCEELEVRDGTIIDPFYCFCLKGGLETMTPEQSLRVLGFDRTATWCISKPGSAATFLEKVVGWCADPTYYRSAIPLVANIVRFHSEILVQHRDLSSDARARLTGWVYLQSFLSFPDREPIRPSELGHILAELPPAIRDETLGEIAPAVARSLSEPTVRSDVESVIVALIDSVGPRYRGGKAGLYRALVRQFPSGSARYWKSPLLVCGIFFAGCSDSLVHDFRSVVLPELRRAIKYVRHHGATQILDQIERRARSWPKSSYQRWRKASRKHRIRRRLKTCAGWAMRGLLVLVAAAVIAVTCYFLYRGALYLKATLPDWLRGR